MVQSSYAPKYSRILQKKRTQKEKCCMRLFCLFCINRRIIKGRITAVCAFLISMAHRKKVKADIGRYFSMVCKKGFTKKNRPKNACRQKFISCANIKDSFLIFFLYGMLLFYGTHRKTNTFTPASYSMFLYGTLFFFAYHRNTGF